MSKQIVFFKFQYKFSLLIECFVPRATLCQNCVVPIGLSHRNKYRTGHWDWLTHYEIPLPQMQEMAYFPFIVDFSFLFHRQCFCRIWLWGTMRVSYEARTAYRSYVIGFLSCFDWVCVAHLFQFFELIAFVLYLVPNFAYMSLDPTIFSYTGTCSLGKNDRWTDRQMWYLHPINLRHVHWKTNKTDKLGINTCFISSEGPGLLNELGSWIT